MLPLPEELRAGAGVLTLDSRDAPDWTELRPSANGFQCFADPPRDTLFDVRCYRTPYATALRHQRALRRAGLRGDSLLARMDADVRGGRVPLPESPSAGYRALGPIAAYDPATGRAGPAIRVWQSLHTPFRTAAELGFPTEPRGTHPFVMLSGRWWSHVMIVHDSVATEPR